MSTLSFYCDNSFIIYSNVTMSKNGILKKIAGFLYKTYITTALFIIGILTVISAKCILLLLLLIFSFSLFKVVTGISGHRQNE